MARIAKPLAAVPQRLTLVTLLVGVAWMLGCQSSQHNERLSHIATGVTSNNVSHAQADQQQAAKIRTQMAAHYLQNHQLDEASRQLQKAFAADASYAPAYDMMGVLLQQEGSANNLAQAEAYFKKAIALDAHFMQAHNNYGVYLSQLGEHRRAIAQFQIAGSALGYYGRIGALENLGLTALKVGDTGQASTAFVRVLESDRNNITAHIELIDLLIDSKQVAQAKNLYNELLVIMGDQAQQHPRIAAQGIRLK
ncbi:tetratricopeptide repeat protein [Psychrobacter lutiphocae]|uniref:tetratricopeptide repeat protein n=1 Tax=Psychrobacter lutiphocae TaxID=540500 RepID=UPI00037F2B7A|nr:tetratricopeptide repeat protein [Psychrobacter lutiphocae]